MASTPRPHWARLIESLQAIGSGRTGEALGARRAAHSRERRHLQHLRRSARRKPALEDRSRSAADSGGRVAVHRSRNHSARPVAEPAARGSLRPAETGRGRARIPAALALRESGVSAAAGRRARSASRAICICWRWIWRARPTASGGCWPIAHRRRRAPAMRWRTAPSSPMCCRICFALRTCSGWRHSSARNAKR